MSQNCNVQSASGRFVSALGLVLALLSIFGSDLVEGKVQLSSLTNGQDPTNILRGLPGPEFTQVFAEMRTKFGSPCDGDLAKYQKEEPGYTWKPSNTYTVTRAGAGYDFTLKRNFKGYSKANPGNRPQERYDECSYTASSKDLRCNAFCVL